MPITRGPSRWTSSSSPPPPRRSASATRRKSARPSREGRGRFPARHTTAALTRDRYTLVALMLPAGAVFLAFFLLPLANLFVIGGTGSLGWSAYAAVLTEPRYLSSLVSTVVLAGATTVATLFVSGISGVFLTRNRFR